MNCRTAIETIAAASTGDLTPEGAASLASHLRTCARCRAEEEFAARITAALAVDPEPGPRSNFTARVLDRIRDSAETAPDERVWMPLVPAAALLSAIGAAWLALPLLPWREVMQALSFRPLPPLTGPAALAPYASLLPALVVGSIALLAVAAREFFSYMRE